MQHLEAVAALHRAGGPQTDNPTEIMAFRRLSGHYVRIGLILPSGEINLPMTDEMGYNDC